MEGGIGLRERRCGGGARGYLGLRLQTPGAHQSFALKDPEEAWVLLGPSLSYPLKRRLLLHCAPGKPSGEARPRVKWLLSSPSLSLLSNSLHKLL